MKKLVFLCSALLLFSCGGNTDDNATEKLPAETPPAEVAAPATPPATPGTAKKEKTAPKPDTHVARADKSAEDKLMDMVLDLPEVRKQDEALRSSTGGRRKLKSFITERPSDDNEYYSVGVGEDNGNSLVTMYTFHVYPDNSVMVYDPVKDQEVSVKKWSRSLK